MNPPRIGVSLPSHGSNAPVIASEAVRRAEELGFDSVWMSDHVVMVDRAASPYPFDAEGQIRWSIDDPMFDALITLAAAGGGRSGREALGSPHGADVAFKAAGRVSSVDLAIRTVRLGGTALLMGICDGPTALTFDSYLNDFLRREIALVTTFGFTRRDFVIGNALHGAGGLDLTALTGPTVRLEEVPAALAEIRAGGTAGKRLVVDVAIAEY